MKFRYFLCFLVSVELTLGDYCLDQTNSSSPVVLKLGTAAPLGSAKQFQGDLKEVANF